MITRILTLVAATMLAFAAPGHAAEPRLSARVVVDSGIVTLGDVLDDAGPAADAVISRAPAPGERIVIRVSHIVNVARANGLNWKPLSGIDRVVITRASQRVTPAEIEKRLSEALGELTPDNKMRIELLRKTPKIFLPTDVVATLDIENLALDRRSGNFSATLVAAAGTHGVVRADVVGRAVPVVDVPVLRRGLRRGEVIGESDLAWSELRLDRLPSATITDPANLIGLASLRSLRPGKPIRATEVHAPLAVTKGASVVMTYRTATMVLTVAGRALDDGAKGDTVRILNTQSNTIVEARVEGSNLVTVTARQSLALN